LNDIALFINQLSTDEELQRFYRQNSLQASKDFSPENVNTITDSLFQIIHE